MARMMIHMHNTLMQFWVEAINITYCTTNNIFLRHGIKETHLMNYGLEENLILNILEPLAVSAIYSMISCPAGVCPVDWCSINWCTLILVLRWE